MILCVYTIMNSWRWFFFLFSFSCMFGGFVPKFWVSLTFLLYI